MRNTDSRGDIETTVALDEQVHLIADGGFHGFNNFKGEMEIGLGDVQISRTKRIPFKPGKTSGDGFLGFCGEFGGRFRRRKPAVGVARNRVTDLAAEQLIDGDAQQLAFDVPERHLHRGERALEHGAAAKIRAAIGLVPERFDLMRIASDKCAFQFTEGFGDRLFPIFEGSFTDAVNPGIGQHFDKYPVRPIGVADERLNGGDFHSSIVPPICISRVGWPCVRQAATKSCGSAVLPANNP